MNVLMKKPYFLICIFIYIGCQVVVAQYTKLLDFNGANGSSPYGNVTLSGSKLYGMTETGGANNNGVIFSIDTNGNGYKDLFDFSDSNGVFPFGSLTLSGNRLYGMTEFGGINDYGVVFSIDTDGSGFKVLLHFNGTDGYNPTGSLLISGPKLYGMTFYRGARLDGLLFSLDTNGSGYKDLLDFNGPNGATPSGSLILSGSTLFGMTYQGGANTYGLVFSIDTNGNKYKDLLDFNYSDGAYPMGSLILSGSSLFGMTYNGGTYNDGVIFSLDTSGSGFKKLLDFNGPDGSNPGGTLILSGNTLYGMATQGGTNNLGLIFSMDTGGSSYKKLFDFNGNNGGAPFADLTPGGGTYFGMTEKGGKSSDGVVFKFIPMFVTTIYSINEKCHGDSSGIASAITSHGIAPFTYLWSPGGATTDTATGLKAGIYLLTVKDSSGSLGYDSVTITQPPAIAIIEHFILDTSGCRGAAGVIVSGGTAPFTYLWSPGGETSDSIFNQCPGNYCCKITDNNGCRDTTCVFIPLYLGIMPVNNTNDIIIFPNPCKGTFHIEIINREQGIRNNIEVYNVFGQMVYSKEFHSSAFIVNLAEPDGIYFYRALSETGESLGEGKIIIEQ